MCKHSVYPTLQTIHKLVRQINKEFRNQTIDFQTYKNKKKHVLALVVESHRDCIANEFIF